MGGMSSWIGWGISTLLLLWMNRKSRKKSEDTTNQQPSKFTEYTGSQIGNCIPVVLGRTIIKNPLVSYYGDYSWRIYTEEYGMHSELNVWAAILPLLIALIFTIIQKDTIVFSSGKGQEVPAIDTTMGAGGAVSGGGSVPTKSSGASANTLIVDPGTPVQAGQYHGQTVAQGTVTGTVDFSSTGTKRQAIVAVLMQILIWLLMMLFNKHMGRTTIQKGFKYYLGWQHILCWTGDNFGLKRIWMNVYDPDIEQSTEQGVWGGDNIIWKADNQQGIIAYVNDENMFGGVDEGGGFIGYIHFYFGTNTQPFDNWMVEQMYQSANVPTDLKGLTPKYPMFVTCVINSAGVYGSQPTPPGPVPPEPIPEEPEYPTIVVIGSGLVASHQTENTQYSSWTDRFAEVSNYNIINRGLDSNTTEQMLERFWIDVIAHHPDYCIMEVGINDWQADNFSHNTSMYPIESTKSEVHTMIDLCKMYDIEPIFLICMPAYNSKYGNGNYSVISNARSMQADLKNYIITLGYQVYPYEEALETSTGYIDLSLTYDDIHPNDKGNELIGDKLYTYMNNLTKQSTHVYEAPQSATVVVIGDSISAGNPYTGHKPGEPPNDYASWTVTFRNLSGYRVINQAIGGTNSDDTVARFMQDVVALDPDYVIFEHGNDAMWGLNQFYKTVNNINTVSQICKSNDIKLIFIQPVGRFNMTAYGPASVLPDYMRYFHMMHEYETGLGYPSIIGYYTPLSINDASGNPSDVTVDQNLLADGVHPNLAGYTSVGAWLNPQIILAMSEKKEEEPEPEPVPEPVPTTPPVVANEVAAGAYIGKQSTVPEMWFEVVNYPTTLKDNCVNDLERLFVERIDYLNKLLIATAKSEGVPSGAQGDYNNLQSILSSFSVNDITTAKNASQALLNSLSNTLALYRRTQKIYNLLDHGVWVLGTIEDDCNPAEVICEILINSYWGCNYDISSDIIDVDSLLMLGAVCEEEGLGISCFINNTAQAYEYIDKILTHINGVKYDDPVTGKLTFKMIRPDYDISLLKTFNPSNCESLEFTRLDWSETSSSVSVSFTLAENKYVEAQLVVSDIANPLITGLYSEFNIDGTYFTVPKNARIMAQTQLLSAAYPLSAVNFVCNRYGYDLNIGEPIVVNWEFYGITKQIFRVTDVDYGTLTDGRITVTALEDIFGFDQTDYAFTPSPVWTDPEEDPQDVSNYFFFEMPYEITYDMNTYVQAYAAQPSFETKQWYVWRYENTDYVMRNTSVKWSTMGRMVYGIDERYDANDTVGFEIVDIPNNSELDLQNKINLINNNPGMYTNTSKLNLLECGGEIMSYSGIEKLANGNYRIYGLVRGVFDTIPKGHVAYDVVHFLDYGLDINQSQPVCTVGYTSGETLEITTSSQTKTQEFDINKTVAFDTRRRTECPSVMGNLQFGADKDTYTIMDYNFPTSVVFSGDINFTYKARNKFNTSAVLAQSDASVIVQNTTKNYIRWKVGSDVYELMFDAFDQVNLTTLEDMTLKWSDVCVAMGQKVRAYNDMYMEIGTYDTTKQLYSYDHYEKEIQVVPPTMIEIVQNPADIGPFLSSLTYLNNSVIQIPNSPLATASYVITYEEAPIIFIGTPNPSGIFTSLNGTKYDLTPTAYRIDGATYNSATNTYVPSWHQITIEHGYVFYTNNTGFYNNGAYYQLWYGSFIPYNIYV